MYASVASLGIEKPDIHPSDIIPTILITPSTSPYPNTTITPSQMPGEEDEEIIDYTTLPSFSGVRTIVYESMF